MSEENQILSVVCTECHGAGTDSPSQNVTLEQGITFSICKKCKGEKSILVKASEFAWQIGVSKAPKGEMRRVLGMTWAGKLVPGEPLSPAEASFLAGQPDNGLLTVCVVLASENTQLKTLVSALEDRVGQLEVSAAHMKDSGEKS